MWIQERKSPTRTTEQVYADMREDTYDPAGKGNTTTLFRIKELRKSAISAKTKERNEKLMGRTEYECKKRGTHSGHLFFVLLSSRGHSLRSTLFREPKKDGAVADGCGASERKHDHHVVRGTPTVVFSHEVVFLLGPVGVLGDA